MSSVKPENVTLRAYQVGFGDCLLLTCNYKDGDQRNVLVDFGSTGLPEDAPKDQMLQVAEDIREKCKSADGKSSKIHLLVATHRHKDHIGGFSREGRKNAKGETTGDIILSCSPDMIIQPWTENPDLEDEDFQKIVKSSVKKGKTSSRPKDKSMFAVSEAEFEKHSGKYFAATLQNMQSVAEMVKNEAERLPDSLSEGEPDGEDIFQRINTNFKKQLFFMGVNNMPNESAVENLREMGKKTTAHYVKFGDRINLSHILPGVKMHVLGPPSLEQTQTIMKQRSRDDNEFWMLHSMLRDFWELQAATALDENLHANLDETDRESPFPKARVFQNFTPSHTRWFIRQIRALRAEQMLGLVRILDKAMNNTSVILLFEIGDKKLLFPGDAQIENWEYALNQEGIKEMLKDTSLYKVGHHGSRNATPKTLWRNFDKRSTKKINPDRLVSVCSTMTGKHGHTVETAVPRATLVKELDTKSNYHTTESIKIDESLCLKIESEI